MAAYRADVKKASSIPSSSGAANTNRSAGALVINEPTAPSTTAVPPPLPTIETSPGVPSTTVEVSSDVSPAETAPHSKKVDKGKRKLVSSSRRSPSPKRARGGETASGGTTADDYIVFCPEWDVRRSDSFFEHIEDRPAALSAFNAFVLPRDIPRLRDVPVDECFDTSKILLAQGKEALDQRDQALEKCKKAEKRAKRRKEEVEAVQKEKEELEKEKVSLEKEKADWLLEKEKMSKEKEDESKEKENLKKKKHKLEKEKKELSEQVAKLIGELKEAKATAIADFQSGPEFAEAIERATFDKYGQGYDACQGFAAAKGLDSSLLDFDAFVAHSIALANPVAEETKAEEEPAEVAASQMGAEVEAEEALATAVGEGEGNGEGGDQGEGEKKEEGSVTIG